MEEIKLTIHLLEEKHAEHCGVRDGHDCDCGGNCSDVSVGVDNLPKSPEEMNVEELIEALDSTGWSNYSCKKCLGDDWCKNFGYCSTCRGRLLNLLKAAHERKAEEAIELIKDARDEYMRLRTENGIMLDELLIRQDKMDKLNQQVSDLTNERDGLKRRLEELSDAGITELHRLLRETIGDAKNITGNARIYVESARKSRKPNPEREAVIERLRKINFEREIISLNRIGCAVLGYTPNPWWEKENSAELRDKLVELLSE